MIIMICFISVSASFFARLPHCMMACQSCAQATKPATLVQIKEVLICINKLLAQVVTILPERLSCRD